MDAQDVKCEKKQHTDTAFSISKTLINHKGKYKVRNSRQQHNQEIKVKPLVTRHSNFMYLPV